MADLSTKYMGLSLNNPIIASSSGITGSIDGVRQCVDAGAGAVVLKSMFEEIILSQSAELEREMLQSPHTEVFDYINSQIGMQMGTKPYLQFIGDVKNAVDVPVIASVNCAAPKWWVSYAADIEAAGADAIELNISHFPEKDGHDSAEIEGHYTEIVSEVTKHVSIPVAVKLGSHFTTLWSVLTGVINAGAKALVLFNRYYTVDIDIQNARIVPAMRLSCPEEKYLPLKWTALASEHLSCDVAASTGIHNAEDIMKMIMAGATAVEICSVLYKKGPGHIEHLLQALESLMDSHSYASISDMKGIALQKTPGHVGLLHRMQYIKALNEASSYEF